MGRANRGGMTRVPVAGALGAGWRLAHPALALTVVRDLAGWRGRSCASRRHLDAAMHWLCRAHERGGNAGVSAGYSILHGWLPPYPETTGYIIPTFFDYALRTGDEGFSARARRMADWEIEVQLPSGGVQAGLYRTGGSAPPPAVFNTGQVILGWCRAFAETQDERFLDAARRAGDWLVRVQHEDGSWRCPSPVTGTVVHAYDVRTAWSLLELDRASADARYSDAARRNVAWTLAQQQGNGWFDQNSFFVSGDRWPLPLTHTIAYVLEGLWEAWRLLADERCLNAVLKTAERLLRIFELRRFLAGEFDSDWKSAAAYSCLPGNAQVAGVWLRVYEATGDTRFLNAALKLNDYVTSAQSLRSVHPGVRGGVKGSQPVFGRYESLTFVNWGAKFLADSLMLEERLMTEFEESVRHGDRLGPEGRGASRETMPQTVRQVRNASVP